MVAEMEGDMVADTKEKDNPKVEKGFCGRSLDVLHSS